MQQSLKKNSILNAVKSLMAVLFPLITTPYVTRILGVNNVGKYSFSYTFVSYFLLIAALGINNYAIREGSALREKPHELNIFINEVFSINIISTIISYALLILCLLASSKLHQYWQLMMILSIQIIFTTIGVEWIYSIFEDYLFITIRSIVFQIVSLIVLVLLVKNENDINMYAWATVISSTGASVWNLYNARKYCNIRFTFKCNMRKHIKPIIYIFASNVAVTIYVNSDNTLLGFLTSDYYVGLYSLATKIYRALKTMLSSLVVVSIPRLSYLAGNNKFDEFEQLIGRIFGLLMTFLFPMITGIICLNHEIVLSLSNNSYIEACYSVAILSVATFFCMLSYIYGQCILMPLKREKITMYATVISAILNVCLNFLLIPHFKHNGAAFTTVIAEGIVFVIYWFYIRKTIKIKNSVKVILQTLIGCVSVAACCLIIKHFNLGYIQTIVFSIISSVPLYILTQVLLKNNEVISLFKNIKDKYRSKKI